VRVCVRVCPYLLPIILDITAERSLIEDLWGLLVKVATGQMPLLSPNHQYQTTASNKTFIQNQKQINSNHNFELSRNNIPIYHNTLQV